MPGYAGEADDDAFAQARMHYLDMERWLAGAEAAALGRVTLNWPHLLL
jgi:hypothetical protein